jgi:iron complex outermembrane receptor protein
MISIKRHPLSLAILLLLPTLAAAQAEPTEGARHDHDRAKQLDELVVTASPLQPGSEEVVKPIEVLAGEALDRQKAGTLGETVAKVVGVQSSFFGAGVGRPIIRGQDGARVQVLEGGISALDVSTVSADHAVTIEPFLADQIEILKGPATLLYGSGAVAGAVNVVDGRIPEMLPENALSGRAELRGNSGADERTGMLRLDGGQRGFAWHVDAFHRESDDYDIPGYAESAALREAEAEAGEGEAEAYGSLPNSALETEGGAFGASWIGERGFIGGAVSTYSSLYGIPGHAHEHEHEEGEEEEEEEAPVRIDLEQIRYDVKGAIHAPFAGAESIRFRLGRNDYEHTELEGDEVGTRFDNTGTEGRVELVHPEIAGWRGAYGLQIGQRDFEAIGEEAFVPPSRTDDIGLFALEQRDFDRWKLELGARYDGVDVDPEGFETRDFDAVSASIGALWRFNDTVHLSLGYDRAQRAPTAEELFSNGAHIATQSFEVGDADLDVETANQFEVALHLHRGPLTAKFSAFENAYDDFIYLDDTGTLEDDLPLRQWTQADATFRGFEAEANLQLADNASGAWSLRFFGDKVRASLDDGGNLPRIVPARFGAGASWERDGWRANIGAVRAADQDKVATFETPTDGYTLVDAHLAYHWDTARVGWEVFLDGNNLTDREARTHTSFLKDLAPLPGRTVAFGVRAFF